MIVHTGEEGEETVYQCRAKLYVMQSDGGWKERGVGALKLNVKSADGKSPRLGKFFFSLSCYFIFFSPPTSIRQFVLSFLLDQFG